MSGAVRLNRETIIQVALELLDEVGLDDLTTRRLADRLGIQSPTLYWHFKSKQALLTAMAYAMLTELNARPVPADAEWRKLLRDNAHSFRRALLSRRDGARIHAGTIPSVDQMPKMEAVLRLLGSAGFSLKEAVTMLLAVSRFVVGWVLEEQAMADNPDERAKSYPALEQFPLASEAFALLRNQTADAAFDDGLSLLLRSLRPGEQAGHV
jgi:TetR/AcrR family transcriptional regulator, tetracycline repressor protein